MKTDDLVAMLANGIEATDRRAMRKRAALALAGGLLGTLALFRLFYGVRGDIGLMLAVPLFWLKFAFALAVAVAAAWMTARLARPGRHAWAGWLVAAVPVIMVWIAAMAGAGEAPSGRRLSLMLGHSWHICTLNIALLSVPLFAALLWLLRGMAPTRPRQAGAAAGLLAGAMSLLFYSLYCTEMALQFWSIWYVLGMLVPAAAGALLGRVALRW